MHNDLKSLAADEQDDIDIVQRVLDGEVNAFEVLLVKYRNHVVKILNRHLPYSHIEETAHDVFIRAYKSLATFKQQGGFKQWLSTIAVRTCYDFWRKQYRSREFPISSLTESHQEWLESVMSDTSEQEYRDKARQKEAKEILDYALESLSPEDRMVVKLVYLEGYTGKEAAGLLG
ncbi:MAG: sigma-70 family RNA polymerase sigma factor, partial [Desulfobacteraceae bacterium]|nr:sigma-70 family RNA polymerase sigma factor [Desulfobacteraceae bacterium]